MTTANVVDISEHQPTTIDFDDLKTNGIKAVIVRLGHGTTQDKNAASHLARAAAAGLVVHGYHYYEGTEGEIAWSIKNAKDLGLTASSYYFLDMEGDIAGSWSDIFRSFYRNWLQAGYNAGLYCSLSKYSLFSDKELTTNKVYKWIADWDVDQAPADADAWQYNCSTGLGQYQDKLDKDVDLTGKLITPVVQPIRETDPNGNYEVKPGAFVGFDYPTTPLTGGQMLVASPDGVNKLPKLGPDGNIIFNNHDFGNIWNGITGNIPNSISWENVQDKPAIPTIALNANDRTITINGTSISIPDSVDLSGYATQADLKKIELTPGPQGERGHSAWTSTAKWSSSTDTVTDAWITDLQGISKDSLPEVGDLIIGSTGLVRLVTSVSLDGSDHFGSFNSGASLYSLQGPKGDTPDVDMSKYATIESVNSLFSEVATLNQSKSITSGTLSDLASGKYEVDFAATDAPVQVEGMLRVDAGAKYKVQTYTAMQADSDTHCRIGDQYTRAYDGSTWSAWHKVTQWP